MRRLAAILVTCTVAMGVTATAAAREAASEPPWWSADRAEMVEHGFALTVPDGWVALDLTDGLRRQVGTLATALGLTDTAAEGYLKAMRGVRDRGAQLLLTTDDANCEFRVDPALGPGQAEALAGFRYEDASDDQDILTVEPPREVSLPSGPAYLMTWTRDDGNPELSMFLGQRDDLLLEVKCSGQSRPGDDWLSVAESFEWLTADELDAGDAAPDASPAPAQADGVLAGPPFPARVEGTAVYDQADVFGPFAVGVAEQVIREIEETTGAQIVVYTQIKPESDTFEEAADDAAALMDEWRLSPDSLVILFDLDQGRCYGQVQLYASDGYALRHLSNSERQKLFDEAIVPPLVECDFDTALLETMSRIRAAADAVGSPPG